MAGRDVFAGVTGLKTRLAASGRQPPVRRGGRRRRPERWSQHGTMQAAATSKGCSPRHSASPARSAASRGRTAATSVRQELVDVVDVRGEIVHKGQAYGSLSLGGVRSWRDFVDRLILKFNEALAAQVGARYGNGPPW